MSDKVLIPVVGLGVLALEPEAFRQALSDGAALAAQPAVAATPDDPLLDAAQLASALGLPQTWVEQAAREGRIPAIRAGRWRRFDRRAVEAALSSGPA